MIPSLGYGKFGRMPIGLAQPNSPYAFPSFPGGFQPNFVYPVYIIHKPKRVQIVIKILIHELNNDRSVLNGVTVDTCILFCYSYKMKSRNAIGVV